MTKQNSNTPVLVEHQFNGKAINQRNEDGYISATAMCRVAGKQIGHYKSNDQTKEYLEALSTDIGIPTSELIQSLKGGSGQQGTWVHPKVAIHLAQWLSPQFAVQVTNWVYDWMNGKAENATSQHEAVPLASCSVIMYHGTAVLMLHRSKKDWVCFQSLCQVMDLNFRHHCQSVQDAGLHFAQIEQTGEKVFCISYQSAVLWLSNFNPEKIRLVKRHKVVSAMLNLPRLLTEARDAYREISKTLPAKPKVAKLPSNRMALLAALEKIEGKKLAVLPCEDVLAFDQTLADMLFAYRAGVDGLGSKLLNSGFTLRSLRQGPAQLELKP